MLFKQEHLQGIKSGVVTKAFRKWTKLAVKKGSQLKTSIGIVEIIDISTYQLSEISENDALQAGYPNLQQLTNLLSKTTSGDIYCISVQYTSVDPRLELRAQTILTPDELELLNSKVARLDKFSKQGNWTLDILNAIKDNPRLKASDLAIKTGKEKDWLKINIRKLKNLGLTISYEPGYTLSPLGAYFLDTLPAITDTASTYPQSYSQTITINSGITKVWQAITDPEQMKQWMSEDNLNISASRKTGSSFVISGVLSGHHFENVGTVLAFQPEKLFTYSHLNSLSQLADEPVNHTHISFKPTNIDHQVNLTFTMSNFPTETIYKHLLFYWRATLQTLKKFVESQ